MRRLVALLLTVAVAPLEAAQSANQVVSIPAGTGVEIELMQDVSSETLQVGQRIPFKLVRPIEVNGQPLLPADSQAMATVESVQKTGHWKKNGAFELRLQPLKLADGSLIHIDFAKPEKKSETGEKIGSGLDAAAGFAYDYPFLLVAPILNSRRGKAFTIRSGERYLVYVTSMEAGPTVSPATHP